MLVGIGACVAAVLTLLPSVASRPKGVHYSFGDERDPNDPSANHERPHIVAPFATSCDRLKVRSIRTHRHQYHQHVHHIPDSYHHSLYIVAISAKLQSSTVIFCGPAFVITTGDAGRRVPAAAGRHVGHF